MLSAKWRSLAGVSIGTILTSFSGSSVSIALPAIAADLHQGLTTIEWVATAFLVVVTSLLLTFGRLGDLIGVKRVYVSGVLIFTLGALFCGVANSFPILVIARVFQGLGGAMIYAVSAAIVTNAFPRSERGLGLGITAVFTYVGLATGPIYGALVLSAFPWQFIFLLTVPAGVLGLVLACLFITESPHHRDTTFDVVGAILGGVCLLLFLLSLAWSSGAGVPGPVVAAGFALSALLGAMFVRVEHRVSSPMLELPLFSQRAFSSSIFSGMVSYVVLMLLSFLIPFYLISQLRYSALEAALVLAPVPLGVLLFAPMSGWLSDRIGSRYPTAAGMCLVTVSFVWLAGTGDQATVLRLILALALNGVGMGLFIAPNNSCIMGSASRDRAGTAAGILATTRNLGLVLGVAAGAAVTTLRIPSYLGTHSTLQAATVAAYRDAFLFAAALSLLAAIVSLIRGTSIPTDTRSGVSVAMMLGAKK